MPKSDMSHPAENASDAKEKVSHPIEHVSHPLESISYPGRMQQYLPSRQNGNSWVWLLVGAVFLPFTAFQTVLPMAAWIAPVFLMRFVRTSKRSVIGFPAIIVTHTAAYMIAFRNGFVPFGLPVMLVGALFYALIHSIPYFVDAFSARRFREPRSVHDIHDPKNLHHINVRNSIQNDLLRTLAFPLTATTLDWLMSRLNPFATYGSPAYSQASVLTMVQMTSITGLWGLTFLITWFAPVANAVWEKGLTSHSAFRAVKTFAAILLVVVLFGSIRLTFFGPSSTTVRVAALTPQRSLWEKAAYDIAWDKIGNASDSDRAAFRQKFAPYVDDLLTRTKEQSGAGAKIVVWSEGAAFVLEEDEESLLQKAQVLARQEGIYLEMGLGVFLRTSAPPFIENKAVLIDPSGRILWEYHKAKPVPGESPMISAGSGIIPSVETPYGRLGTAICYDMDYPTLLRQAGKQKIDILLVPANDFEAHKVTHSQMATYRAVENGFSLIRPASLGISLGTDYLGRSLGSADYFVQDKATMVANIPVKGSATIYPFIGDLFALLTCAGLVTVVLMAFRAKP